VVAEEWVAHPQAVTVEPVFMLKEWAVILALVVEAEELLVLA
jgi:hypothetical protein